MDIFEMHIDWATLVVFGFTFLLSYMLLRKPNKWPPGPPAFPLLGSFVFLRKLEKAPPYIVYAEAAKQYGDIMTVWVGPNPMVIINGYDAIHQALVNQASDFNDRPNWITQFKFATENGKGVTLANGEEWKIMRKFALHTLKGFGVGKASIEQNIIEEAEALIQVLNDKEDTKSDLCHLLQYAISNVICSVVCGQRFDYNDETFQELIRSIHIAINGPSGYTSSTNFLPRFLHPFFPKDYTAQIAREEAIASTNKIISQLIDDHESTYDPDNIRDFIDIYIQSARTDTEYSDNKYFYKGNMFKLIYDLFQAGIETTSTALDWAFLYMTEYPQVQEKCRQMILDQVGSRTVRLDDRTNLLYVEATLLEILRLQPVVPLGAPRTCADHDVSINGYVIPKRTFVTINLHSSNHDSKYWTAPYEFKPERFFDASGKVIKQKAFASMSYGPRNCLGEALAHNEMFLFLCNLLQKFEFKRKNEDFRHDFSTNPEKLITTAPAEYELKIIPLM